MLTNAEWAGQALDPESEDGMAHWYLIHGAASSRLVWSRQMRVLPSVTRADLPLLPDIPPEHLIEALADACLKELSQPVIVMGHSLGGAIAQVMALKAPTLISGLVLVGTGPHLPVNPTLIQSLHDRPKEALEKITRWSLAKTVDPTLLKQSLQQVDHVNPEAAYRQFLACTYFDVRDRLSAITCPRAIITGADDRMTPSPITEEFRQPWPDTPYYLIEHAGHTMMLEQPSAFNEVLTDLMDRFNW